MICFLAVVAIREVPCPMALTVKPYEAVCDYISVGYSEHVIQNNTGYDSPGKPTR